MNRTSQMDKFGGQYFGGQYPGIAPTICSRCIEHIEQEQRNRDYKNIPHGLSISVCQFRSAFEASSAGPESGKRSMLLDDSHGCIPCNNGLNLIAAST